MAQAKEEEVLFLLSLSLELRSQDGLAPPKEDKSRGWCFAT